tara:strand:- start:113 stop:649 length:537 start_codon:yes stop_codon:yes gene_type:complete
MKKNLLIITLFISIFVNFTIVHSEECDLEFDIGEDFTNVTNIFGQPEIDKNIELLEGDINSEKLNHGFILTSFKTLCPDYHPQDTEIRIHSLGGETVLGFELLSSNSISEIDDKKLFLFYYIQDHYAKEAEEVFDPKWLGNISWEKGDKKFYYSKILKFNALIVEELIITNNEYRKYW